MYQLTALRPVCQHGPQQMAGGADTLRTIAQPLRLLLPPGEQIWHRIDWQTGRNNQEIGKVKQLSDRREIMQRVIAQRLHGGQYGMAAHIGHQQRQAVRHRLLDSHGGNRTAAARPVLHHKYRATKLRHTLRQCAGKHIRVRTGCIRHNQLDGRL